MTVTGSGPGRLLRALPEGRLLPEEVWQRRHRFLLRVAVAQAVALVLFGLALGVPAPHAAAEGLAVAAFTLPALAPGLGRAARSAWVTLSLLAASVVLVHLADGLTEAHFHFFVVVGLVSLYQSWLPFGEALAVVLLHHALAGLLVPEAVYGAAHAQDHPLLWAAVHGGFVLAASLAHLAAWRLSEQQGLHDPLTGLANRTRFTEVATRALADPRCEVAVLFVDLDDFKAVNDSRGHAAGDQVLVTVASRLSAAVRDGDLVARLGGDEFAVLLTGSGPEAERVAERVLRELAEPVQVDGQALPVRASVGLATARTRGERDVAVLVGNADLAMYAAKGGGKGRLSVYAEGMAQSARDRALLAEELALALAEGSLDVHYQPVVDLDTGAVTALEALARWDNPRRGPVPPAEFLPLAEEAGLLGTLGEHVLTTALTSAAGWRSQGRPVDVSVNISPQQLRDDALVADVRRVLGRTRFPARRLVLEVAEGALVDDIASAAARVASLRAMGVRVAIDDFGMRAGGLAYLRGLPVDMVKLHGAFVGGLGMPGRGTDAVLLSSLVELARSLRLDVVAEGVETAAQLAALRDLRCASGQGHLFARPLPAHEVPAALQARYGVPVSQPPAVSVAAKAPEGTGRAVTRTAQGPARTSQGPALTVTAPARTSAPARPSAPARRTHHAGARPAPVETTLTVQSALLALSGVVGTPRAMQAWQDAARTADLHGNRLSGVQVRRVLRAVGRGGDAEVAAAARALLTGLPS